MKKYLIFSLLLFSILSCSIKPKGAFNTPPEDQSPDYSKEENWAALPNKEDFADKTPNSDFTDNQADAEVDVFFLHPTTYTGVKKVQNQWNAPLEDGFTNDRTDETTIMHQASVFNGAGKIYAPRYRQAHLHIFYVDKDDEQTPAAKAYELAYQDVKKAFEYYLKNYNSGRPIIIAAHSQGTGHGIRLVKEFFDGKDLQKQLVAAYLVGWPVKVNEFENISACEESSSTNCFCTWRSYQKGHIPDDVQEEKEAVAVTNPLNWKTDATYAPKELNLGTVLRNYEKVFPYIADAQVQKGILWVTKPKFPGSFLWTTKNYHVADLNLYWVNVRKNAIERVEAFLKN